MIIGISELQVSQRLRLLFDNIFVVAETQTRHLLCSFGSDVSHVFDSEHFHGSPERVGISRGEKVEVGISCDCDALKDDHCASDQGEVVGHQEWILKETSLGQHFFFFFCSNNWNSLLTNLKENFVQIV